MTAVPELLDAVKNRPTSVGRMFLDRVEATPDHEAYRYPTDAGWASLTWAETKDRVWALAAGLISLGIEAEQRVAIASSTRIEWILADLGINSAGAATTTVYPNTAADDVAYILADSNSRVVFAEDDSQVAKIMENRAKLDDLITNEKLDGQGPGELVITLAELEPLGQAHLAENPSAVDDAI